MSPAVKEAVLQETLKSLEWILSTSFGQSFPPVCTFRSNVDDLRRLLGEDDPSPTERPSTGADYLDTLRDSQIDAMRYKR